jgi:hypothetical protein
MADAGFEVALATVLLLADAFGDIDHRDFPGPANDLVIALFGFALFVLAIGLGQIVKRAAVTGAVLTVLAAGNVAFAALLAAWALLADGFSHAGRAVVWVTVAGLLLLGALEALLLRRPRR